MTSFEEVLATAKTFRKLYKEYDKHYINGRYAEADKILEGEFIEKVRLVKLQNQLQQHLKRQPLWEFYRHEKDGFDEFLSAYHYWSKKLKTLLGVEAKK